MHSSLFVAMCLIAFASAGPHVVLQIAVFDQKPDEAKPSSAKLEEEWKDFRIKYGKSYASAEEEAMRKEIFATNLKDIDSHNALYLERRTNFTMGVNPFADMNNTEFVASRTGLTYKNGSSVAQGSTGLAPHGTFKPKDEVDWRANGYVTPVKDQGQCGSCWAFSATGALEGQHFRKTGKLVSLSEQNLVDCANGSRGCNGGFFSEAFKYIQRNGGIDAEDSYPYEAKDKACRYKRSKAAICTGFVNVRSGSESELEKSVASVGPICVGIDTRHTSFQLYKDGVYNEPKCSSSKINHAVLVVGYGKTDTEEKYWIVKNSWGEQWGNKGYIYMSRNKNNQCGIATMASYPLV